MKQYWSIIACFLALSITIAPPQKNSEYLVNNDQELNAALTKVQPGETIIWKNGSYQDVKINFKPKAKGTAEKPIVLKVQTAGKATFSGSSQIFLNGEYLQVEGFLFAGNCTLGNDENVIEFQKANHCSVNNCAVENYTLTEESGKTNNYVAMRGTYNELKNCFFSGKTNKGPTVVVDYEQPKGYVPGSDSAPSTYHHIHHNFFGYRTYSTNGGEHIRLGTSTTSFTHGFNLVEYNYFEDERIEAEVISSKSWDNIYRFNTFMGNDGGMVIRHGQKCFVYGNYINGKSGRNESAGLRVINPNNTVFNNYLEELEGGDKGLKSPITIMSGLVDAGINEYYPADNAIVAYNTVVNSVGPAIKIGIGNVNKGKALVAPKNVQLVGNTIINSLGKKIDPILVVDSTSSYSCKDNVHTNGKTKVSGFTLAKVKDIVAMDGFSFVKHTPDKAVIAAINQRLALHKFQLSEKEITEFNPKWKLSKTDVGVSWMKKDNK